MRVAAVIPAYNEAERIPAVIKAVRAAAAVHEIIVVDDGSTDLTAASVPAEDGLRVLSLPHNHGKGGAMLTGVRETQADVIVFLDADLVGLTPGHVDSLIAPITADEADMTVGVFHAGRAVTDLSQFLVPYISGQRSLRRETFTRVRGMAEARFAAETLLTRYARASGLRVAYVPLAGVTHIMKEEKRGLARGVWDRFRMYGDIARLFLRDGFEPADR